MFQVAASHKIPSRSKNGQRPGLLPSAHSTQQPDTGKKMASVRSDIVFPGKGRQGNRCMKNNLLNRWWVLLVGGAMTSS